MSIVRNSANINGTITNIIFGRTQDYASQISGTTAVPVDIERSGTINAYKVGTEIYVLSNYNILANPDCQYMFEYYRKVTTMDLEKLDTRKAANMQYMFYNDDILASIKCSNWKTISATNMNSSAPTRSFIRKFSMRSQIISAPIATSFRRLFMTLSCSRPNQFWTVQGSPIL